MYADDLLLLSNSISDLQAMVDICVREFESTDLSINLQKSCGIRIGPGYKVSVASISVNKVPIVWKSELKFLGVHILASSSFKCNLQPVRQKFFRSLNGLFGKIGTRSAINVTLSLFNSFCVPILSYGSEALELSCSMYNVLETAYSSVYYKIFGTYDKKVIKSCQFFCGYLPCYVLIDWKRLNFVHDLQGIDNFVTKVLFEIQGKKELVRLMAKHKITCDFKNRWKSTLWSNFSKEVDC